jgi:dihydroxyacetone kinase-like protein
MNASDIKGAVACISGVMNENKDYLISLDQQNGDGDLGISMSCGFGAVTEYLSSASEEDLGKLLMKCSSVFNESAPSSLGTILSFGMIGMAKALKGKSEASLAELSGAMDAGVRLIMEKAGSKPGEKTVLDALCPAVGTLAENSGKGCKEAFSLAAIAAAAGSESTREMRSVHGRAAYYGDKSIGLLDGGSVVGKLIFEGIEAYCTIH